jgi:hypothetical protein
MIPGSAAGQRTTPYVLGRALALAPSPLAPCRGGGRLGSAVTRWPMRRACCAWAVATRPPPAVTVVVQSAAIGEEPPRTSVVFGWEMLHASQPLQVCKRATKDLLSNPRGLHPRLEALLHLLARVDVVAEVTDLTGVA